MLLEPVPDKVFKLAFNVRDSETGLMLSDANSFNFLIDHRRMYPNIESAQIEIDNWNVLFNQNKPDTP